MTLLNLDNDKRDPAPLRKFKVFLSGLRFAVTADFNVAYKIVVSIVALLVCGYFFRWVDFFVILVSTGVVISAELFNSAIEALCDFVQPNKDERIRVVKDIAAAAASIGMAVWVVVIGYQLGAIAWYFVQRYGWVPS